MKTSLSSKELGNPSYTDLLGEIARTQSKTAFVQLFDYFAPRVKSFLLRGGLNEAEAEELAQETLLMVWQKAPQFNPLKASASTWIYTIARNKKIDRLRKNRFITLDLDALAESGHEIAAETVDMDWMQGGMEDRLTKAIAQLPEEQSTLVKKAFFEDMSHAAIAAATKIPLGTVKSRLRLGLAQLRKKLFSKGDASPFSGDQI